MKNYTNTFYWLDLYEERYTLMIGMISCLKVSLYYILSYVFRISDENMPHNIQYAEDRLALSRALHILFARPNPLQARYLRIQTLRVAPQNLYDVNVVEDRNENTVQTQKRSKRIDFLDPYAFDKETGRTLLKELIIGEHFLFRAHVDKMIEQIDFAFFLLHMRQSGTSTMAGACNDETTRLIGQDQEINISDTKSLTPITFALLCLKKIGDTMEGEQVFMTDQQNAEAGLVRQNILNNLRYLSNCYLANTGDNLTWRSLPEMWRESNLVEEGGNTLRFFRENLYTLFQEVIREQDMGPDNRMARRV